MQSPFEPLLLNLRRTSYNSNSDLQNKPKSPTQSPKNKPTKRNRPQTTHSLAPRRERPKTRQARPISTIQRIAHLNKTFSNYHGTSFLQFSLKNPDENGQEKNLQEIGNKLQASKAPRNDVVTLQDLALRSRVSNHPQEYFNRTSNQVNQNQTLDDRMILNFQKVDNEVMNRSIGGTSFMEYSPIRRTEGSESPNRTVINESHSIWDAMGKLEKRVRKTDQQMRIEDGRDTKMNDTFDLSRDVKAADLSLTQDEKVFRKIGLSTSKRGKEDMTPSAGMSNTFQSSKIDSANTAAFGRKGKNINRSVDNGMEKLRLDTLNDSVTVTNEKNSTKKKDEPRKYDGYKQVATEEERERMSKFLKDDFVNEMLMNKYHVDMDKFQIRDAINDIHKKANQDKLLRQKFRDFLKNGIIEVPSSKQAEPKGRGTLKKTSYLEVVQLKRKKSETFTSDLSDDPINVVDTSFDLTSKEGKRSRDASPDNRNRNRLGDAFLINPFDFKRKNMSPAHSGMKSARSDDDDNTSKEDSRDDQQRREMNRIRLMEMKKTLNNKFNKGSKSKEETNDVIVPVNLYVKKVEELIVNRMEMHWESLIGISRSKSKHMLLSRQSKVGIIRQ